MTETEFETLNTLLGKQRSLKITWGVSGGLILIIYFFTFAMLYDKFPGGFIAFEIVTSILIFISFFMLNRISFALLKLFAIKKEQRQMLGKFIFSDVELSEKKLREKYLA